MSTITGRAWAMAAIPIFIGGIAAAPAVPVHAAPCSTWTLPNQLELAQGDGWRITVPASGKATYTNPTNPDTSYGDRQGGLNGARLVMDIFWNNNSVGHYEADVTADGALVGRAFVIHHQRDTEARRFVHIEQIGLRRQGFDAAGFRPESATTAPCRSSAESTCARGREGAAPAEQQLHSRPVRSELPGRMLKLTAS